MNHRQTQRGLLRSWAIRLPIVVLTAALVLLGCSPAAGPVGSQLAAEPMLAATMPGATEVLSDQRDPSNSLSGRQSGYAWRIFGTKVEAAEALAWHRATFEAAGWAPIDYSPLGQMDGRSPQDVWRRGDLVLAFGILNRENLNLTPAHMDTLAAFPTVYEVSIVYGPVKPSPTE
jgi:hypothetical protein